MQHFMWILGMVIAGAAAYSDWRFRRIPNRLTVSAFLLGLTLNSVAWGWHGTRNSLIGAAIPMLALLPLVMMRGLGAGDWKLMVALGSILGWAEILLVLLASVFVAGMIAFVQVIRQRRAKEALANMWGVLRVFAVFGIIPNGEISLDNPNAATLPFGVAAAAATVMCYLGLLAVTKWS
ncbi:MAG: A24 family peptidase [Candidatus Acidiferrales bacterium]